MKNASNEGRKKQDFGLPTFKLPTSTKNLTTNPLNIILTISDYDDY